MDDNQFQAKLSDAVARALGHAQIEAIASGLRVEMAMERVRQAEASAAENASEVESFK